MKVKITKIKLQLKDREIELSAEEARQVLAELQELFASEEPSVLEEIAKHVKELATQEPKREYVPYPVYPPYTQPIIIERPTYPPYWRFGEVYCVDMPGSTCGSVSGISSSDTGVCLTIGGSMTQ